MLVFGLYLKSDIFCYDINKPRTKTTNFLKGYFTKKFQLKAIADIPIDFHSIFP